MSANTRTTPDSITAPGAPPAVGPYVHGVRHGDILYCSGALLLDPNTQALVANSLAEGTEQCLRTTIYTTQLDAFAEINRAYATFFADSPPARVTVGVAALPKDARAEIDAMVAVG